MGTTWGNNIKLTIFGESHGKAIGGVIDGLPPGLTLNLEDISKEMKRRAPGQNEISTPRNEKDAFEILSGYFNHKTTGTPLAFLIWNKDQRSKDYGKIKDLIRPGHGDYPGYIKYKGFNDYRGGGHFSGRITAPLVFAGSIAKQLLEKKEITIGSHIKSIYTVEDIAFPRLKIDKEILMELREKTLPLLDVKVEKSMKEAILKAKEEKDSLGGIVETAIINLPVGVGAPFFDSVESELSSMLFSIPAIKGVEFGHGFSITHLKGSQAKDEYTIEEGKIKTLQNHNGGILGGITNGMPILFKTAIKPTSSIGQIQRTIHIKEMKEEEIQIEGRHDPCIVPRAVPVIEAATALVLLDLMMDREGEKWID